MKTLMFVFATLISLRICLAQDSIANARLFEEYFAEIEVATKGHKDLWNRNLLGPILLVDPVTRKVYSNHRDSARTMRILGHIYTGELPANVNIANTAMRWNGTSWAMIILPLPLDKQDRVQLLAHELFHLSQPALGFKMLNADNNHLDQKDGRILLRLELNALVEAVKATNETERLTHVTNALTFRKQRYALYPDADSTENQLELNEGLAEYTGWVISHRNAEQTAQHFSNAVQSFIANPTYVRSFAYQTTPMYGYLLRAKKLNWNKDMSQQTNLTEYFTTAFNVSIPNDFKEQTQKLAALYNGDSIVAEETRREEKTKQRIADYKKKFIEQPHLKLSFEQMNVSFDPGNIIPLDDKGTVYPNIRVTDNWGILTVENGALMSPNWDYIVVTAPQKIEAKKAVGDGWTLELAEGYALVKDDANGKYTLVKK